MANIQVTAYVENLGSVLKNFDKLSNLDEFDTMLLKSGLKVEKAAKENLLAAGRVNTGYLIGSIKTSDVKNHTVEVFTTAPYATYVEYGTGAFAEAGNGRKGWWVYVDEECGAPKSQFRKIYTYEEACRVWHIVAAKYGKEHVHITQGQHPVKFMRRAYLDNREEIINDLQTYINGKVDEANHV